MQWDKCKDSNCEDLNYTIIDTNTIKDKDTILLLLSLNQVFSVNPKTINQL